ALVADVEPSKRDVSGLEGSEGVARGQHGCRQAERGCGAGERVVRLAPAVSYDDELHAANGGTWPLPHGRRCGEARVTDREGARLAPGAGRGTILRHRLELVADA